MTDEETCIYCSRIKMFAGEGRVLGRKKTKLFALIRNKLGRHFTREESFRLNSLFLMTNNNDITRKNIDKLIEATGTITINQKAEMELASISQALQASA